MSKHVRNGRVLRAMERAGHFSKPPEHVRPKGAMWGSGYAYVDTKPDKPSCFNYRGSNYEIRYIDGCFLPFVFYINES